MSYAGPYDLRLSAKYAGDHYSKAGEADFTMTLIDPCPNAQITLQEIPKPFPATEDGVEDTRSLSWALASLYYLDVPTDCGDFTLEFKQKRTGEASYVPLEATLFSVDQAAKAFEKLSSTNLALVGSYDIVYTITLASYTNVVSDQS